ncbi:MAG TPA: glutathione S-transferase family protein [Xanthobacteraceae bacterium]|nr:glutathione S-transferase family protein [Xanthobacteraceae bacterium]
MRLFHHPFCPHSRFIRLVFGEYGIGAELIEENVLARRPEFLELNPAGTTPVLIDGDFTASGAVVIAEFIDEVQGPTAANRLMPMDAKKRAEARRLMLWFHEKFFAEVSEMLVREKILKRRLPEAAGGGPPDSAAIHAARSNIRYHLKYIGWLMKARKWLAGDQLTYADLAAAAHLSSADYLGDVPWNEDEAAKNWYARVKSRPSFRPLLAESVVGLPAAPVYADLDF